LLEVVKLSCARGDRPLFRHLSFHLKPGELIHLQGPNGAGKTTLLRTLCGLSRPLEGEIRWQGQPVREVETEFRTALCHIGHANALHGDLSGAENLDFDACLGGGRGMSGREALSETGLARTAGLPTKLLSQGQKRRTALAALLVQAKPLWILDEPLAALDVRACEALLARFAAHLNTGGAIILTSHQEVNLKDTAVLQLALEGL